MKGSAKVLLAATLIGLGTGMIYMLHSGKGGVVRDVPTNTNTSTANANTSTNTKVYDWATWDGEGDQPRAKVVIQLYEGVGTGYGFGHITGVAYNRTSKKINYISISLGVYTEGGTKTGSCTAFMDNFGSRQSWQFDAMCTNIPSSNWGYKVEDVTYW